jgi:alpha-mannosidase
MFLNLGGEMSSNILYLVCNAHLDPVWLWEWEEGAGEALSTFRTAARFCKEFPEFIFCHNERILYKWIEEFEPELFERIQDLVRTKQWHIMGGWYLQPDCNLPSGESFVRQILLGKLYFQEKFGADPKTAINFDPFGHSRGLVQILKKSGYSSYVFCRPDEKSLRLKSDDFIWVGYDGSKILCHRASLHYNSQKGKAGQRIREWIKDNPSREIGLLLWGIGNHGGGPSRSDLEQIRKLIKEKEGCRILHGVPEDYFEALASGSGDFPVHEGDLNPWAVGCYTSMSLVKQKHRKLENSYFLAEKMVTYAALEGYFPYPAQELQQALEDLLFCEFHDILPGSSISEVEEYAVQRMDHGLEILSRLRAKAFFSFLSGQPRAEPGEFPIFIFNPHPFSVTECISVEFQPQEPNLDKESFWAPELKEESGTEIPLQLEKESSNISVDQRKKIVFHTKLLPSQMNRFTCCLKPVKRESSSRGKAESPLMLKSDSSEVVIDTETGWIQAYRVQNLDYLLPGAFRHLVVEDNPDPWGMLVRGFPNVLGAFRLMTKEESARFAGVLKDELEPVRIIEDGPVRTIVEALFKYNNSCICQQYVFSKKGSEFGVNIRVYWNEKDRMLKLSIPTSFQDGSCRGQVAYGTEEFSREGEELVAQKWVGVASKENDSALTVINSGTYGFDHKKGELRLSLLRSPAYSGHPVDDETPIVPQDRFVPRIDQGERIFKFWINGGKASERFSVIDREAQVKNEFPVSLCCFPSGEGKKPLPGIMLSDDIVQLAAVKIAEKNNWLILRFFEPTGSKRNTHVSLPVLGLAFDLSLDGFEIKTIAVDRASLDLFEVDLLERKNGKEEVV